MADQNKTQQTFQPRDLVLVRKQAATSNATEGKPAKLTLKARGPHRILEEAGKNSRWIQKLPASSTISDQTTRKKTERIAMRMKNSHLQW
jgi:hypothetical protein